MIASLTQQLESTNATISLLNEDLQEKNELIQYMEKKLAKYKNMLKQQELQAEMQNGYNDEKEFADQAVQVDIWIENRVDFHELKMASPQQKQTPSAYVESTPVDSNPVEMNKVVNKSSTEEEIVLNDGPVDRA